MNHIAPSTPDQSSSQSIGVAAKAVVEEFLRVIMIPDPEGARAFIASELEIHFTGDRLMRDPRECSAFNASRYKWVKKRFERTDVVADASDDEAIVYNICAGW